MRKHMYNTFSKFIQKHECSLHNQKFPKCAMCLCWDINF